MQQLFENISNHLEGVKQAVEYLNDLDVIERRIRSRSAKTKSADDEGKLPEILLKKEKLYEEILSRLETSQKMLSDAWEMIVLADDILRKQKN